MENFTNSQKLFFVVMCAGPAAFFFHILLAMSEGGMLKLLGISFLIFLPAIYFFYTPVFDAIKSRQDVSAGVPSSDTSIAIITIVFSFCFLVVSGSNWAFGRNKELSGVIQGIHETGMRHLCDGDLVDLGANTAFCVPHKYVYQLSKHDSVTIYFRQGIFGPTYFVGLEKNKL